MSEDIGSAMSCCSGICVCAYLQEDLGSYIQTPQELFILCFHFRVADCACHRAPPQLWVASSYYKRKTTIPAKKQAGELAGFKPSAPKCETPKAITRHLLCRWDIGQRSARLKQNWGKKSSMFKLVSKHLQMAKQDKDTTVVNSNK